MGQGHKDSWSRIPNLWIAVVIKVFGWVIWLSFLPISYWPSPDRNIWMLIIFGLTLLSAEWHSLALVYKKKLLASVCVASRVACKHKLFHNLSRCKWNWAACIPIPDFTMAEHHGQRSCVWLGRGTRSKMLGEWSCELGQKVGSTTPQFYFQVGVILKVCLPDMGTHLQRIWMLVL